MSFSGGIFYTQIFFDNFNINASNFFSIVDYLSSSIDILLIAFISVIISLAYSYILITDFLHNSIVSEQYNIKNKFTFTSKLMDILIYPFYLYTIQNDSYLIFLNIIIIAFIFNYLPKMEFWFYIKNRGFVSIIINTIVIFFNTLIYQSYFNTKDIYNNKFNNEYTIKLDNNSSNNYKFIKSNSSYTFLFHEINKNIIIIPNKHITSIISN